MAELSAPVAAAAAASTALTATKQAAETATSGATGGAATVSSSLVGAKQVARRAQEINYMHVRESQLEYEVDVYRNLRMAEPAFVFCVFVFFCMLAFSFSPLPEWYVKVRRKN
jgi:hypothetical protein